MANNPNHMANLKKFSSEYQPKNKNGRKPSQLKKYIQDNNVSAADVAAACKYVLPLTEKEMGELANDKAAPLLMRAFAASMVADIKAGKLDNIMTLLNRSVGMPKLEVDHTGQVLIVNNIPAPNEPS